MNRKRRNNQRKKRNRVRVRVHSEPIFQQSEKKWRMVSGELYQGEVPQPTFPKNYIVERRQPWFIKGVPVQRYKNLSEFKDKCIKNVYQKELYDMYILTLSVLKKNCIPNTEDQLTLLNISFQEFVNYVLQ